MIDWDNTHQALLQFVSFKDALHNAGLQTIWGAVLSSVALNISAAERRRPKEKSTNNKDPNRRK